MVKIFLFLKEWNTKMVVVSYLLFVFYSYYIYLYKVEKTTEKNENKVRKGWLMLSNNHKRKKYINIYSRSIVEEHRHDKNWNIETSHGKKSEHIESQVKTCNCYRHRWIRRRPQFIHEKPHRELHWYMRAIWIYVYFGQNKWQVLESTVWLVGPYRLIQILIVISFIHNSLHQ